MAGTCKFCGFSGTQEAIEQHASECPVLFEEIGRTVYFVDIDETICITQGKKGGARDYSKAVPIKENIKKINKKYDECCFIVYWTSRGALTGIDWYETTERQLIEWGCKFNQLRMDKPPFDCIIDDKAKRIEEL